MATPANSTEPAICARAGEKQTRRGAPEPEPAIGHKAGEGHQNPAKEDSPLALLANTDSADSSIRDLMQKNKPAICARAGDRHHRAGEKQSRRKRIRLSHCPTNTDSADAFIRDLMQKNKPAICARAGDRHHRAGEKQSRRKRIRLPPYHPRDDTADSFIRDLMQRQAGDRRQRSAICARAGEGHQNPAKEDSPLALLTNSDSADASIRGSGNKNRRKSIRLSHCPTNTDSADAFIRDLASFSVDQYIVVSNTIEHMRRIHIPRAAYLVTTNPINRISYFEEDALAMILQETIFQSCAIKGAVAIAFKINPDHLHLIVQVGEKCNISNVMQSIKRMSSININQVLDYGREGSHYLTRRWHGELLVSLKRFLERYGPRNLHEYPLFRWQPSFHDRLIRTKDDLNRTIEYLRIQHIKHKLNHNKWLYVCDVPPVEMVFVGEKSQ